MVRTQFSLRSSTGRRLGMRKLRTSCCRWGRCCPISTVVLLYRISQARRRRRPCSDCLPPNIRSIYVHAHQSLLWNKLASERVVATGVSVQEGDVGGDSEVLDVSAASPFEVYVPLPNSA
ncbi:hypothetical protein PMAYCL1PPCAC_20043 [Pristionchus mayeri]|uniref:TRUD domain-containing protein n=1 Tax=Pristionchus mayeri TaxID=1317129 RepID=A0AAN5CSC2_9BILA|nr:hypothetical protein PMAYCL1PPCAC_20043 [Pristionchus mayeri]